MSDNQAAPSFRQAGSSGQHVREGELHTADVPMSAPERIRKWSCCTTHNDMTMKEIGGLLGINESRVSQIHRPRSEKMRSLCNRRGFTRARVLVFLSYPFIFVYPWQIFFKN